MNVVGLTAQGTGRFYPPGKITGTYFSCRLSRSQGLSAAERMSVKISEDTIGNRTRDLTACGSQRHRVPPPPPRQPRCMRWRRETSRKSNPSRPVSSLVTTLTELSRILSR
jgi:hypothetical protein